MVVMVFLDAISHKKEGYFIKAKTLDPIGRDISSCYYVCNDIAFIELAKVSGLSLLKEEERNPLKTNTYGLGILIKDAIDQGIKKICIGIGGSATHDVGTGMLQALGVKFYYQGKLIEDIMNGSMLNKITSFDLNAFKDLIKYVTFDVVTDVSNPLLGESGAAHIYAAQKGASKTDVEVLENGTKQFADLSETYFKADYRFYKGSGAAGGIGFCLALFMHANLFLGIDHMIDVLEIETYVKHADLVIVGEGKLDAQTAFGKAPFGIAKLARKHQKKVIGLFATMDTNINVDYLDEVHVIVGQYVSESDSMNHPKEALRKAIQYIFTK
jgi:glycerate kinase